ncbi:MAG: hypothetical protein U9P50_00040 [Patescibacteria group bacterium]|nr:hypothetical protein [Patescibacteria group bacterium]
MKKIFRKAMTVLASTALIGMTVGGAFAASYPTPFTSNTAIVVGANAAPSDNIAASSIASNLDASSAGTGTTTTTTGGDSYKFEKTSTKFNLGDTITGVISSSIDDDELPTLLAEGKYLDNDNDEFDYTQKITMEATQLEMFDDDDYATDSPTVGFKVNSGTTLMTYTLTFSDEPLIMDLVTTDLPFMGKTYYVLSNSTSGANLILTLLDSASDTILSEGESTTLNVEGTAYAVSINFISSTEVKLTVNGETTNSLAEGGTYKLSDGSYIGIKDIMYTAKDTGISKVELSIGSGKLTLTSGSEVKINDDAISGLTATLTNSTAALGTSTAKLTSIAIAWAADEDLFIAEDTEVTMPGFNAVKMSYGGLTYPVEETIEVKQGGTTYAVLDNFPLKDGEADINFLWGDSTSFTGLGKDTSNRLVTAASGENLTFNADNQDDYFVVSYDDGSDAESYLMRANNFVIDGSSNKTDFEYYKDGVWTDKKTGAKDGDTFSIGNAEVKVWTVAKAGSTKTVKIQNNSANTNFYELWSKEGMRVALPIENSTYVDTTAATNYTTAALACAYITDHMAANVGEVFTGNFRYNLTGTGQTNTTSCATTFKLVMNEEDKNGNKAHADGDQINVTLGWDASTTKEVEVSAVLTENDDVTEVEIGETDVWREFAYSPLATEILWNKPSSGQKSVKLIYHGDEVAADVYITSPEVTLISDGDSVGVMTVKDSEVASVSGKNLVVVGGSAINSVAAELLGGAYSEGAFTSATGVAAGEFMIKSFSRTGNTALLVAGYNAADTEKAVTYLLNNDVDTTVGKNYKGTSATEASLVIA